MPRNESLKVYNTFVGGLVTEATPLTFPENSSLDSLNVTYDKKGDVKRRLGLDYEASSTNTSLSIAETTWDTQAIGVFEWKQVGGDGDLHFLVIQVDATLYYYDISSTPVSGNKKTFTTDLSIFAAPAASDVGSERIDVAFGKGYFFIVSKKLKPFYVTYDPDGDSITNTEIGLLIRDFDGVDDSLDIDEELPTLSDTHNYNLTNQGWVSPGGSVASPITTYFSSQSKYPGNNKQWFVAKNSSDDFDPAELTKIFFGNTLAPRGHWILDPFNQDRSTVSGISNITSVTSDNRPEAVAFFAGRSWYGGPSEEVISGHLYFSQIIEDPSKIGRCYQEADPTSEEISDLVDTDGGVIVIPEAGSIVALHVTGSSLLVFANNGLWEVTGSSGSGFTPTDYSVSKVSSVGLVGSRTLVDVEGTPVWWSDRGIYSVGRNEITDRIEAKSLTEKTIQTFYDEDIENISKLYGQGSYDSVTKRVTWLYNSVGNETSYRFKFDKALVFDTVTGSFSPYDHGSLASNSPYTAGVFTLPSIGRVTDTETVIQASSGSTVIRDSDSEVVVADVAVLRGSSTTTMLWTVVPGSSLSEWTFSQYSDADFFDWTTADGTGINFDSYFETGYLLEGNVTNYRRAPWVWVFSKRTETGYISDGAGGYNVENPSSCYLQPRWDFADHSNSSKFGRRQQIYRILKDYDKTPTSLDFNSGFPVTTTKSKVRGKGRALTLRFESESGKDFDIYGWAVQFSDNAAG
jgi:hypothetical protein